MKIGRCIEIVLGFFCANLLFKWLHVYPNYYEVIRLTYFQALAVLTCYIVNVHE